MTDVQREKMIADSCRAFVRAARAYLNYERKTHFVAGEKGENLYRTEMNLISEIKENKGICMTALAEKTAVTVGAVSQIMKKLENKGLIIKEKDRNSQSKYVLSLTEKGMAAHENHMRFHRQADESWHTLLQNASAEQIDFLTSFFKALDTALADDGPVSQKRPETHLKT